MKVKLWYEECLKEYNIRISEIEAFILLVKKHGFTDANGLTYEYSHAHVDHDGSVTIYFEYNEDYETN